MDSLPDSERIRTLVKDRLDNFWGYGSLEADTWFVGMEEGLSSDGINYIQNRFEATFNQTTVDMREGMEQVPDHYRWFGNSPSLQPTWRGLIEFYLYLKKGKGDFPTLEERREFQSKKLADKKEKETAALELMPLPNSRADEKHWIYGNLSIPGLKTRKDFENQYKKIRVNGLKKLINKYSPKLVVFYSLSFIEDWKSISYNLKEVKKQMHFGKNDKTAFCAIPHSTYPGMSYKRIHDFVDEIREKV